MFRKMSIVSVTFVVLFLFACKSVQKSVDEDKIYFGNVDVNPLFNGKPAEVGFCEYVWHNICYPAKAFENCIVGRVFIEFIVEKDGSVNNVKVTGGADPILEAEALRVVKLSPSWTPNRYTVNSSSNWTPGKIDGKAVRMSYTIPISFRLGCENVKSSSKKAKLSKKTILLKEVDILAFGNQNMESVVPRD